MPCEFGELTPAYLAECTPGAPPRVGTTSPESSANTSPSHSRESCSALPAAFSTNVGAFSSNAGRAPNSGSKASLTGTDVAAASASTRYSFSLPRFDEARNNSTGARTEFQGQHGPLFVG